MALTKVWIEEGCTSCGVCEDLCPEVFKVEDAATVKKGADVSGNEECVKEAAESCPVEVIKYS